jgi:N-acetylmuramoyl-L-alanine amidase
MRIRKWGLLASVFFILTFQVSFATSDNVKRVVLNGNLLDQEVQVMSRAGSEYINLPIFSKYFNVIVAWNIEEHDLFLKMGKLNIKFYANDPAYFVNGVGKRLDTAPFEQGGQFWLPVQFLTRLDLNVQSQDSQQLSLGWNRNYLLGIENIQYQGRPSFLLRGTGPMEVHDQILNEPNRLVLTLSGVVSHFSTDDSVDTGSSSVVKKVHFDKSDPSGLKIIFDLNQITGYQLLPVPGEPNQIRLVFNYKVEKINVFAQDDEKKIIIATSTPADFQVRNGSGPEQLALDLAGADLEGKDQLIQGDGSWCRDIRLIQSDSQQVRVEVHWLHPESCFVFHPPEHPNWIELRPIQTLENVKWSGNNSETRVSITSNGELNAAITPPARSGSLQVELKYIKASTDLVIPEIHNSLIEGFHLSATDLPAVKINIGLEHFVNYQVQYSADHKQMTLVFSHSPLVGKTIIIDPGHGGEDNGAFGRQIREKDVNLEVAIHLKNLLEQAGAAVILTRTDDYFVGLYERPFMANDFLGDLFISIHTNNHPDLSVHGIEVFYYPNRPLSQTLARLVLNNITQYTGFTGLGAKSDDFVVIRETEMPSILVEVGFLSNFQEENIMKTPEFKDRAAEGIYQGILDYWQSVN